MRARNDEAGGGRGVATPEGPNAESLADLRGVLHDVANALTVVLGWVEQAGDVRAPEAERAYALGVVRERARLAQELARQVLVRGAADDETARLDAVVDEVLRALGPEASAARVSLSREGDARGALVRDARALARVVTNLVLNALAHAPPEGRVVVRVDGGEEEAEVAVVDDGPGVPEASGVRLRGASRRAEVLASGWRTPRGRVGSRGRRARAVGGRSGRDVRHRGRGDAIPRAPSSRIQLDELAGVELVVVADDAAVVQLLVLALETRGARVRTARSRAELDALLAAPGASLDALLVDLSPLGGGPDAGDALVALAASLPRARFVVVTGSVDALPVGLDTRRVRVVKKPFEAREVVAAPPSSASAQDEKMIDDA